MWYNGLTIYPAPPCTRSTSFMVGLGSKIVLHEFVTIKVIQDIYRCMQCLSSKYVSFERQSFHSAVSDHWGQLSSLLNRLVIKSSTFSIWTQGPIFVWLKRPFAASVTFSETHIETIYLRLSLGSLYNTRDFEICTHLDACLHRQKCIIMAQILMNFRVCP